jgi:hypothetical protein
VSLDGIHILWHIAGNLGRRESAKEFAQGLLLLWGIGWVAVFRSQFLVLLLLSPPSPIRMISAQVTGEPKNLLFNRAWLALEPVGHEYLVLLVVVAKGEDVGTLHGLVKVAKDVINDDNGLGGVGGAGDI